MRLNEGALLLEPGIQWRAGKGIVMTRGVQWAEPHFEPLFGPFLEGLCKDGVENGPNIINDNVNKIINIFPI